MYHEKGGAQSNPPEIQRDLDHAAQARQEFARFCAGATVLEALVAAGGAATNNNLELAAGTLTAITFALLAKSSFQSSHAGEQKPDEPTPPSPIEPLFQGRHFSSEERPRILPSKNILPESMVIYLAHR